MNSLLIAKIEGQAIQVCFLSRILYFLTSHSWRCLSLSQRTPIKDQRTEVSVLSSMVCRPLFCPLLEWLCTPGLMQHFLLVSWECRSLFRSPFRNTPLPWYLLFSFFPNLVSSVDETLCGTIRAQLASGIFLSDRVLSRLRKNPVKSAYSWV